MAKLPPDGSLLAEAQTLTRTQTIPAPALQAEPEPGTWQARLAEIVTMMREMSRQTDPQEMVAAFRTRIRKLYPVERALSISRRDLEFPFYRITRFSGWAEDINPWKQKDRLPLLQGGLLAQLIYGDEPRIIPDLADYLDAADPAASYLAGKRSLVAVPNYDRGAALNMNILLASEPSVFDPEALPDRVLMSNLFGRATHNLVLMDEVKQAYHVVDRELRVVADIQRSLLPREIPDIPNLSTAAYYQTSRWAGGDYYDFFPLPSDQWGLLIADVSGHGTPAAVMMAITHSIAHSYPGHPMPPAELLGHVNQQLSTRYMADASAFVTAFYGIFDPHSRTLTYACAGHNPPRLRRCGDHSVVSLDAVGGLPLGVFADMRYDQAVLQLRPGDQLVLYTDGITEATDRLGHQFGTARLDDAISSCPSDAGALIQKILDRIAEFTGDEPADDDRTLLVARVL
jgi:sigma-B regulation protein RsbU (phosphoserine phosphatase)